MDWPAGGPDRGRGEVMVGGGVRGEGWGGMENLHKMMKNPSQTQLQTRENFGIALYWHRAE